MTAPERPGGPDRPEHLGRDLAELFASLRRADARGAPPFDAVLAGARARRARQPSGVPRTAAVAGALLAAVAVAVTVAVTLFLPFVSGPSGPGGGVPAPFTEHAVEDWSAPSDELLTLASGAEADDLLDLDLDLDRDRDVDLAAFDSPTADLMTLGADLPGRAR